ncbi:DUF3422 family protein [Cohaesibacter haloalkalitolerans]|uniref:DUF3422 family protein n=1 Tax=Cohaesibacter haloalkalitolerans TaxID=1162980 RepID=UPI000E65B064|nr:DUF3422 domain-containing protein [Cohaesibacter haloalkalitolerans]
MADSQTSLAKARLNHSMRAPMIREMHARPFLELDAPSRLAFIALKPEEDGLHTAELARQQLVAFLEGFGAPQPEEGAVYHIADLGGMVLKWENHTEFATYTLYTYAPRPANLGPDSFATDLHDRFTIDWLEAFPGRIVSSVSARIETVPDLKGIEEQMSGVVRDWFGSPSSFAAAYVSDGDAAIAADFDLDNRGQIRLAVLACRDVGASRLGRVIQRFLEVETYRAMSMLTLPVARQVLGSIRALNIKLSETVARIGDEQESDKVVLDELLGISAELSMLSTSSSSRFNAGRAYEELVMQRIGLLREQRILERQLFSEFMKRRYQPSMRTCRSAQSQLDDLTFRAAHASELLGTRVQVTTTDQNRQLLAQMDRRAALQIRLQETVEGLSVVAISYYAVSLLSYLLAPAAKLVHLDKSLLSAALVVPVVGFIWFSMHKVKQRLIHKTGSKEH